MSPCFVLMQIKLLFESADFIVLRTVTLKSSQIKINTFIYLALKKNSTFLLGTVHPLYSRFFYSRICLFAVFFPVKCNTYSRIFWKKPRIWIRFIRGFVIFQHLFAVFSENPWINIYSRFCYIINRE